MSTVALLHPDDEALVKRVQNAFESGKDHHEAFRKKADRFYAKYRSYKDFKKEHRRAARSNDVDSLLRETAGPFGTNLVIPYAFSVIETTVPRMLSHNPRMLITPADEASEANVENNRLLLNRQQSKIGYPLVLQDVAKDGLMYGIGWQKTYWQEGPAGMRPRLERGQNAKWVQGEKKKAGYCGPMAEALDPYDVIWDPVAHDVATLRWILHRAWRDNAYVTSMLEAGTWELPAGVDRDQLLGLGSDEARDDVWRDRMAANGMEQAAQGRRGNHLHEVWEWHDTEKNEIVTVLDRTVPVAVATHPYWHGELPFQTFRPTRVPHEMLGIGEIEPIEDLLEEMNILRSQRRDNAAVVLQRPYFYFDGLLDPADFVFGPGKAIPVDGDPRNVIFPAPLQDIPGSGYQEEARLQQDIERTSGIDDTVSGGEGGGGASSTATGVQMVNAAANLRIQFKTKRLEQETVKPACWQFVELNQQFVVDESTIPGPPRPGDPSHKHYAFYRIGPEQLAGEWDEIEPEGGSMSPQSKIERQSRAKELLMAFQGNPVVEQRKLYEHALEEGFEIVNPAGTGWLAPEEPSVPPEALDLVRDTLAATGVDPAQFDELVEAAVQEVEQAKLGADGGGGPQQAPPAEAVAA